MLSKNKLEKPNITSEKITQLFGENYFKLISSFYEMQSDFFRARYKIHNNLEISIILISLIRDVHLSIFRQRENDLEYNISLDNFFENTQKIVLPSKKIISIVKSTGIPKETVRRKIKKLVNQNYIGVNSKNEYFWNFTSRRRDTFYKVMGNDINFITKFIGNFTESLDLDLSKKLIENELKKQFSFYFYHFLNCQLNWLKLWQQKIYDIDLLFIAMQAIIPTLQYTDKKINLKKIGTENLYTVIGKTTPNYKNSNSTVNATSISDISGIPRATCIRKLDKLVSLGLLIREIKTKRYYVNQTASERTKHITQKEYVLTSVEIFSEFLSVIIRALVLAKG